MRNATKLTIIPGYWDKDLTQVQVDYVPTSTKQTVAYWAAEVGETRSCIMDGLEDPIAIHSVTIAHVAAGPRGNGTLLWEIANSAFTAKETLELIKSDALSAAELLIDVLDALALFENLPEVGIEQALTGRNTPGDAPPTCLEETTFYWNLWNLVMSDDDVALAARERATNPKVIEAIDNKWW